jgi:hypothetical protein
LPLRFRGIVSADQILLLRARLASPGCIASSGDCFSLETLRLAAFLSAAGLFRFRGIVGADQIDLLRARLASRGGVASRDDCFSLET